MHGNNVLARVNAVREDTLRNLDAQRAKLTRADHLRAGWGIDGMPTAQESAEQIRKAREILSGGRDRG